MTQDLGSLAKSVARSFTKVPRRKIDHYGLSVSPDDPKIKCPANYDQIYPDGISPFTAYSFLKEHFGTPQWRIRNNAEYEKIQWMYFLKGKTSYLEIYDWKLISWHVRVSYEKACEFRKVGCRTTAFADSRICEVEGCYPSNCPSLRDDRNVYRQNYVCAGHILGVT